MEFKNGVTVLKWPHKFEPTEELVKKEAEKRGYTIYDCQTIPPYFERGPHTHNYPEIRAVLKGVTTFHWKNEENQDEHATVEAGDIILIPAGTIHEVKTHNANEFTAFKGSTSGIRSVTEHS